VNPLRRRRALHLERSTLALAVAALGAVGGVAVTEIGRVWHKGSAPGPVEADHILDAAVTAVAEASEVARAGLRETPERETALLNLFVSFVVAFGFARVSTWTIRRRGRFGPFRDLRVGNHHVHHFVPGMILALLAGGYAIVSDDETIESWLALPFGAGLGLTLDESALLLEFDDVYWTEEGVLSLQVALTATALLGGAVLARRVGRRGEADVLEAATPPPAR
jgi:hypothetical protein